MSPRAWRWIVALALVATAVVGAARQIEIPGVSKLIRPRVECQDSPECRSFIRAEVERAVKDALQDRFVRPSIRHHGERPEGVVTQSGSAPGQQPGPPQGGSDDNGGNPNGGGGGTTPGPGDDTPPEEPGIADPLTDPLAPIVQCHIEVTALGQQIRVCNSP